MKRRADSRRAIHTDYEGKRLGVVEVRHVSVPDADHRLSRAMDLLLKTTTAKSASSEANLSAEKEELSCQDTTPEAINEGNE